jgi:hypothetical protein
MARARKHGVVRRGRTTTFYGDDAERLLAYCWVDGCFDNRKCAKYINGRKPGLYKDALIERAKYFCMVEDAKKPGRVKACKKP